MKLTDFRPIFLVNGILLCIVSLVMLLPALVDYLVNNPDWKVFAVSSVVTGFVGGVLFLTNRGYKETLSLRQTFLFTATSYFVISFFVSLPLYLADLNMRFVDALFEGVSGFTATGATVMTNLDNAPPGILLWRSMLQAMGGIGIVVLTMVILPTLQIGGMQLFRTESSDKMDKMLPRATQIAATITMIFVGLMVLCALSYYFAGMNGFDAFCHAMTTIATGGYSTHDASIGFYKSAAIETVAIIFMTTGALPLLLYYQCLRGNYQAFWQDPQVQTFFAIIALVTATVFGWLVYNEVMPPLDAARYSLFSVISVITTTGYSAADYGIWGGFTTSIFFMLIVVGGCTGSTSGGIKIFRYRVFYETAKAQVMRLLQPHGVFVPRYNKKPVSDAVSASVLSFFLLFAFSFMVLSIALSLFGLDFLTSMSAAAQALANVGPGLGPVIGPSGNYATLPDGAKLLLSFAMILGRLELFTIIVLFAPHFWRD